ncbi:MAG: mechanosensitive ion channel [Clostridia bacterium]|nr:mechanosensitive ion channel [Clostridia bacterium]
MFLLETTAEGSAEAVFNNVINSIVGWVTTAGVRLLIAIVILFVSFKVINAIARRIEKKGNKDKYDKTIMKTIAYIFKIGLKIVIAICLVGYVGIDTSGLTALVASLGVCAGLAVNGALSNLAGGVLLILTRPFKIDDYIEAQGYSGTVEDIHITNTRLRTPDNKVVYIPNGALSTGNIVNYSEKDTRRVDFTFSVGYGEDFERAKTVITDICNAHELVLSDPEPFVRVSTHADSSINIVARVWVKSADYWTVNFDILESVKTEFDKQGIKKPYNQLDVHVKND